MRYLELFPELDAIPGREFTPSEIVTLAGVPSELQRIWRSRLKQTSSPLPAKSPYSWVELIQWALMRDLTDRGLSIFDAAQVAMSKKLRQTHEFDFRNFGKPPLFLFCRTDNQGRIHVSTNADAIEFNTGNRFWGDFGFWLNYSAVQDRVVTAYEKIRMRGPKRNGVV